MIEEMAVTPDLVGKSLKNNSSSRASRNPAGFVKLLSVSGLLLAILLPIGIYPRVMQSSELDKTQKTRSTAATVSVIKAEPAELVRTLALPGNVEAILETPIYARANGYVHSSCVDIGDRVQAGQLLAEIETPEVDESAKEAKALVLTSVAARAQARASFDKAHADLASAEADLAQAKANLVQMQSGEKFAATSTKRWSALVKEGVVSNQDADEKETGYTTAKAATQAAQERVRSAESQVVAAKAVVSAQAASLAAGDANIEAAQARQRNSDTQKRFQKVLAPFAGVIVERNIDQGSLISSGSDNSRTSLFRLARIDTLRVFIDAPQFASTNIHPGLPAYVTLKEFPGRKFKGTVARTSVALNAMSRTLKVEVHIPNKDLLLAPGMYADVAFSIPRRADTLVIPITALISRGEGEQVAVLIHDAVHFQPVQTGDDLGKKIEVTSGLKGTERVINTPSDSLKEGEKVEISK